MPNPVQDVDGDGASELFGLQSDQMEPHLDFVQCRNGQTETLWGQEQAAFETTSKVIFRFTTERVRTGFGHHY